MKARTFDKKFDQGEDISEFLDLKTAIVVKRVNVDFPAWMVGMLDQEAVKLNVSRQAIIKMWIRERLDPSHRITR
ncbi:MAG: CopG family transcriptional regulator [Elusimicrobia bacterium]|nr:MAG: CopG family transcriptional regulator [Elusimicrobiota bacterium]